MRMHGQFRETMRISAVAAVLAILVIGPGCSKRGGGEKEGTAQSEPAAVETVTSAGGAVMVAVPAGSFMMGSEKGQEDEKPVHKVDIGAFLMDRAEITQKEYERIMGRNPSKHKAEDNPVEQVNWLNAAGYCNMRSVKEGLKPCYDLETQSCDFSADGYRLPTEAEWEYACRSGTDSAYSSGDNDAGLDAYAWTKDNSGGKPQPVSGKKANRWGLYDMHGNVWEWCNDYYGEEYYSEKAGRDPKGPAAGDERVLRGGSWKDGSERARSAARRGETPMFGDVCFGADTYGFRCVRRPAGQ